MSCAAYCGKGTPLARGGRRYRPCKRPAAEDGVRFQRITNLRTSYDRELHFCSQHAAQFDLAELGKGFPPRTTSDER